MTEMTQNAAVPGLTDEQVKQKTEDILEALRDVVDPELGINVVDLGLIYGVLLDGPGEHHRRRARAAAGTRLQHLARPGPERRPGRGFATFRAASRVSLFFTSAVTSR